MTICLDHVFICCDPGAPEANALLALGLKEGSPNSHPGQGTANRRFFFERGLIELLWVANPEEAQSEVTSKTRLWPRWLNRKTGASPFGVAFCPSSDSVEWPTFPTWEYRPQFLPANKALRFSQGAHLSEPELYALSWPNAATASASQPTDHLRVLPR